MRQVLLIGSGRLSSHLQFYFSQISLPFIAWSRKHHSDEDLRQKINLCSHVLVAIRDDALESFISSHDFSGKTIVHFSGSLVIEGAYGAHPLMTFGPDLYELETYKSISFVLEKGSPALFKLIPHLENSFYFIPREQKALYHALCVSSGNFTTLLWQKVFKEFEALGLPREMLFLYLDQVVANLKSDPAHALTGPLARRDVKTIRRNLSALEGRELQDIYQAFVKSAHLKEAL